jgi:hypothetical protein
MALSTGRLPLYAVVRGTDHAGGCMKIGNLLMAVFSVVMMTSTTYGYVFLEDMPEPTSAKLSRVFQRKINFELLPEIFQSCYKSAGQGMLCESHQALLRQRERVALDTLKKMLAVQVKVDNAYIDHSVKGCIQAKQDEKTCKANVQSQIGDRITDMKNTVDFYLWQLNTRLTQLAPEREARGEVLIYRDPNMADHARSILGGLVSDLSIIRSRVQGLSLVINMERMKQLAGSIQPPNFDNDKGPFP